MERAHCSFAKLDRDEQVRLIETVRTSEGTWHGLPAMRTFSLWMRYVPVDPMPWIRRSDEMRAVETQQEGGR
jgi:hypothetical protein